MLALALVCNVLYIIRNSCSCIQYILNTVCRVCFHDRSSIYCGMCTNSHERSSHCYKQLVHHWWSVRCLGCGWRVQQSSSGLEVRLKIANQMHKFLAHSCCRYMLGLAAVPSIIQLIGFMFMPESPRWLIAKDRQTEAVSVLKKIRNSNDVTVEVEQIRASVDQAAAASSDSGSIVRRVVSSQPVRRALFVGCMMQVFQQISGINTVM